MTTILGIDPGSSSAGVVLLGEDGRTILSAWLVVYRKRKSPVWEVLQTERNGYAASTECERLHNVAHWIRARMPVFNPSILCVEGLFVPRARRGRQSFINPQTVIPLAEACGELVGPLRGLCVAESERPEASTWRPTVAGIPAKTPAKRAAELVVPRARAAFDGWGDLLDHTHAEHVADAAFIARWAWVRANNRHPGELDVPAR